MDDPQPSTDDASSSPALATLDDATPADSEAGAGCPADEAAALISWFDEIDGSSVEHVGGKAASLGEMLRRLVSKGVRVPNGFATTADAYRSFLEAEVPEGTWAPRTGSSSTPRRVGPPPRAWTWNPPGRGSGP